MAEAVLAQRAGRMSSRRRSNGRQGSRKSSRGDRLDLGDGAMTSQQKRLSRKFRRTSDFLQTYEHASKDLVQGWLKRRSSKGLWQRRWFVLHGRFLSYLKKEPQSKADFESGTLGSINLWNVEEVAVEDCDITIRLGRPEGGISRTQSLVRMLSLSPDQVLLKAQTADMAQRWVQAMYAGPLEGQAQRAFDAQGSSLRQVVPSMRRTESDATRLQLDASDPSSLRDDALEVRELRVLPGGDPSRRLRPLFETKRMLGMSRLAVGRVPLSCRVAVDLGRSGRRIGTVTSGPIESYRSVDELAGSVFTVYLEDPKLSADAVRVVLEQDTMHAMRHAVRRLTGQLRNALVALLVLMVALAAALGPTAGLAAWAGVTFAALLLLFAANKDALVLTSVALVPMHEARAARNRGARLSKRRSSKRRSSKRAGGEDDQDDETADEVADDEIGDGPELSERETELVAKLRAAVQDLMQVEDEEARETYDKFISNDFRIVRFLRARNLNLRKAERMLRDSLGWRVDYGAERIHDDFQLPDWIKQYGGSEQILDLLDRGADRRPWYFRDRDGHLAVFLRSGRLNIRKIFRKLGNDGEAFFRVGVWLFQLIQDDLDAHHVDSGGKNGTQITLVVDLEGFSMSNQIPINQAVGLARKYLPKLLNAYPEVLGKVLVINAPWLFHSVWNLFTPFLPARVLSKISIQGSSTSAATKKILSAMDASQVPVGYSGSYVEADGDPFAPKRVPCRGPFLPDKGESLLKKDN